MKHHSFAVFILTHGRASIVSTDECLRRHGYTGDIYYLIDDEDSQAPLYIEKYGSDHVIQFCKKEVAERVDAVDNFGDRRAILYARHAVFDAAESLGLEHFQMLDDDVTEIQWRWVEGDKLRGSHVKRYDDVVDILIDLLDSTGALSVALSQGGDFIGGANNALKRGPFSRKCMNSFICRTDKRIEDFKGTMNEDVAAYTINGQRGNIMLSCNKVSIVMGASQSADGGMSEFYKETGTYVKTAYSLVTSPACVRVAYMSDDRGGGTGGRIHHNVIGKNAFVKIVRATKVAEHDNG